MQYQSSMLRELWLILPSDIADLSLTQFTNERITIFVKFSSGMITKNFDANNSLESVGNVRIFEHLCIVLVFLIATVKGASTDWNFTLICFVNLI